MRHHTQHGLLLVCSIILSACQSAPIETLTAVATKQGATNAAPSVTSVAGSTSSARITGPHIATCPLFPMDNIWNTRVDSLPVHSMSEAWIDSIGREESFHMDFGSGEWDGGPIGIPYNMLAGSTVQKETVEFYYPDESNPGPYPLPPNP